jgi:hypothetical protein
MKKLLLLAGLVMGLSAYAQVEDYRDPDHFVVKTSGDTIFGKLKYTSSDDIKNKIVVKVNDTLKYTIKASDVKYFRDGDKEYLSFQPEMEDYYFIKIWQEGKYLSCYEWQVPAELSGSKIEYLPYIRQAGDKTFVELDLHWAKHLVEYIEDYEELADDVWKGKYKLEQLGDVIRRYNEWKEENK